VQESSSDVRTPQPLAANSSLGFLQGEGLAGPKSLRAAHLAGPHRRYLHSFCEHLLGKEQLQRACQTSVC